MVVSQRALDRIWIIILHQGHSFWISQFRSCQIAQVYYSLTYVDFPFHYALFAWRDSLGHLFASRNQFMVSMTPNSLKTMDWAVVGSQDIVIFASRDYSFNQPTFFISCWMPHEYDPMAFIGWFGIPKKASSLDHYIIWVFCACHRKRRCKPLY